MEYIQALTDLTFLFGAPGSGDHIAESAHILVTGAVEDRYAEVTCMCGTTVTNRGEGTYLDLVQGAFQEHLRAPISDQSR